MLAPFFKLGAVSPGRQQVFRQAVIAHLLVLGACAWAVGPGVRGKTASTSETMTIALSSATRVRTMRLPRGERMCASRSRI